MKPSIDAKREGLGIFMKLTKLFCALEKFGK
jgi:hypothetical protein